MKTLTDIVRYHNQKVIGWRDVPVDIRVVGPVARASMPVMKQLFIARMSDSRAFERTLFMIRKRAGKMCSAKGYGDDFYVASLSSKTVVYKGLMLPEKLTDFYRDLQADDFQSRLALVHSRFSTNTFPTWERAHPYRRIAHNGEINTLRGNQNWMRARESLLASKLFEEHLPDFKPIIRPDGSDSASLDNVVDFLVAGGRSLPHVMMMLVPEAWATQADMPEHKRAFYEYHASLVEPWDGPAALVFTDGDVIGATLDRNGLRPAKYVVTKSGLVVMSSELGVLTFPPEDIVEKGRLAPGKMFLVDVNQRRIVSDEEIKREVATRKPYGEWVAQNKIELAQLPDVPALFSLDRDERARLWRAFGYTREDMSVLLAPMAMNGEEPTGSMGTDIPLAVLSDRPVTLFRYFKQQFAQVTNPPIDPIREDLVMSLVSCVGGEGNLLEETPGQCRLLELPHPILTNGDLAKLLRSTERLPRRHAPGALRGGGRSGRGAEGRARGSPGARLPRGRRRAQHPRRHRPRRHRAPRPDPELARGRRGAPSPHPRGQARARRSRRRERRRARGRRHRAAHRLRRRRGEPVPRVRVDHRDRAGAARADRQGRVDLATATKNYIYALKKGLLKVMSKMGISTIASYHGAQIFEAIGISKSVIDAYFTGTSSPLGGIGIAEIATEARTRHAEGFGPADLDARPRRRRRVRLARDGRAAPLDAVEHRRAPEGRAPLGREVVRGVRVAHQRPGRAPRDAARPARPRSRPVRPCRSPRSRRRARSCTASPPAR